jgi:hypothetical protein
VKDVIWIYAGLLALLSPYALILIDVCVLEPRRAKR